MIFEHHRWEIWNPAQHPLMHDISAFGYTNPALPGVSDLNGALDYIVAVLYPKTKDAVNTPADLPLVGNEINDMRVVLDDGDGLAAAYRWTKQEGEVVASWWKIYDMDWGTDNILSQFYTKTLEMYVYKHGYDDLDKEGHPVTGLYAGQVVYGGASANTNLTLRANSGDGTGARTGYVQIDDNFRPSLNNTFTLGTATEKFKNGYFINFNVDTLTFGTGSITDSSGSISFGTANLVTSGTLASGTHTISSTLVLASGSITDTSKEISFSDNNLITTADITSNNGFFVTSVEVGALLGSALILGPGSITDESGSISFGNENLSTTGTLGAGVTTVTQLNVDNVQIDGNGIVITNADGNLTLTANGTGKVDVQSPLTTLGQTVTGTLGVTGQLNIDNLRLDANTISSTNLNGNVIVDPNGNGLVEIGSSIYPTTDSTDDLGKTGNVWNDLHIDGNIKDASNVFSISDLMKLKSTNFRDVARTEPVQNGDTLFYDSVNNLWLASHPDSEISHEDLSGLTTGDAGHTQFAVLTGRTGGQTIQGGTAANNNLILESTSHATKGTIQIKDNFLPYSNAAYSGGWSGTNLGGASNYLLDVYTKGQFYGFRVENVDQASKINNGSYPAYEAAASNVGRLLFAVDTTKLYVDTGSTFKVAGVGKHVGLITGDGTTTTWNIDVSANISDARLAIIQLLDIANDYERVYCSLKATSASNVRVETNVPFANGATYRLIVIE